MGFNINVNRKLENMLKVWGLLFRWLRIEEKVLNIMCMLS